MNTTDTSALSSDEKLMGAVAHLFGPLIAIIVWATQKDKSRFIKFQALQALTFDVIIALVIGTFFFCLFGATFLGMFGLMFTSISDPASSDAFAPFFLLPTLFPSMMFGCVFPLTFVLLIIRLIAALSILNGRNYHYPIIGKWLEKFLEE